MGDRHEATTLSMHRSGDAVAPDGPSRRALLGVAGGLLAGAAMDLRPRPAAAQRAADAELARVQAARRILLKGGVVLTLDSQVGDFARADVLIEDGKIREIRPDVAVSGETAAIVDASNRILIPGFVDTHSHSYQGLIRMAVSVDEARDQDPVRCGDNGSRFAGDGGVGPDFADLAVPDEHSGAPQVP